VLRPRKRKLPPESNDERTLAEIIAEAKAQHTSPEADDDQTVCAWDILSLDRDTADAAMAKWMAGAKLVN
jgi:hypothetical protein